MRKTYYCWKTDKKVPMLTKKEWRVIEQLYDKDLLSLKQIRVREGISLDEALKSHESETAKMYCEITGYDEGDWQSIQYYRLSLYGPECRECGDLFRTPNASICASCGAARPARSGA